MEARHRFSISVDEITCWTGSVPFFLGLTVMMPVLGHATWHLYRKAVEPDPNPHPDYRPREKGRRFAADFPAARVSRQFRSDGAGPSAEISPQTAPPKAPGPSVHQVGLKSGGLHAAHIDPRGRRQPADHGVVGFHRRRAPAHRHCRPDITVEQ